MRVRGGGILTPFVFFDGDRVIGRISGEKYFKYECDPGEHIFWAKSEHRSFLSANLSPGKVYIIEAWALIGVFRVNVQLKPVNPKTDKLKKFQKLLATRKSQDLAQDKLDRLNNQLETYMTKGLERFEQLESKGKIFNVLSPDMYADPENLEYQSKMRQKNKSTKKKE